MMLGTTNRKEMTQDFENMKQKPSAETYLTLSHDQGSKIA